MRALLYVVALVAVHVGITLVISAVLFLGYAALHFLEHAF